MGPSPCFSCVLFFATPWTAAYQAPLAMGFSSQEYWSGLPFSPPGDLSNPGRRIIYHLSHGEAPLETIRPSESEVMEKDISCKW